MPRTCPTPPSNVLNIYLHASLLLPSCFLVQIRISYSIHVYFCRVSVFAAISMRPSLASLSGKSRMAAMAFSEYSFAKARVCSMPSLRRTNSLA